MSASGRVFRRDFLRLTAGAALLTVQSKTTQGSPPPEKPAEALKIVVFSNTYNGSTARVWRRQRQKWASTALI
jgi:hypothetical protein